MGHVPSSTWKDGSPPQERLGQHVGTVLTCWAVGGLLLASRSKIACSLCCLVSGQCHPPHQTGLLHFSPPVAACWRGEGTFPIHHPPRRPSSPSLHQQNRKASPSSLSSFCPPLHPLLEKGSLVVHQVCGWRHIVPCVLGGVPLFPALYRHGTIEDHSCSGGPGPNLAAVCGFFPARASLVLRRTWRGGINTELRWKYAVHQSFSWSSLPQRWTLASCCINGGLHCYSPAVLPASSFAPSVSLQHGGSQPLSWNGG